MTEAEELELLELEAEEASAKGHVQTPKAAAPAKETPSRADAALAGVQNLGTFGWGDELGAGLQAGLSKLTGAGDFSDTYRKAVTENRAQSEAAKQAHKGIYYAAGLPAGIAASMALPAFKAAQGAPLLVRALTAAGNGVLQGGLAGAGESEAKTLGGVAKDAGVGALAGGAVGGALPLTGAALKGVVGGVVRPGATARELARLGVDADRLTLGQMNPEGAMAQLEEAGQHAIGAGGVIKSQRAAGEQAWRDAVLARSTAPYTALTGGGDTAERLGAAYEGFSPAYEAIGANPVTTAGPGRQSMADQLRGAFKRAVGDEGVIATDADRSALGRDLENQASAVHFQPGQASSVADLQSVRSNIRQEIAQALRGPSPDRASVRLLQNAEQAVTQQIEGNLPQDAQAALRSTDGRYALHKTVEDAVRRAGDAPQGLMPQHLSAAVKAASDRGAYARGGGGDLRELAVAGREALQTKTPPTGVRALMQLFPGSHYVQSPVAALANTGSVKRALLGQTAPQLRMQALIDLLQGSSPAAKALVDASGREATTLPSGLLAQEAQ